MQVGFWLNKLLVITVKLICLLSVAKVLVSFCFVSHHINSLKPGDAYMRHEK